MATYFKQFGGKITKELKAQYEQSPNWQDGKFQNFEETSLSISFWDVPEIIYKQLTGKDKREPKKLLAIIPFDKEAFLADDGETKFIWYGHSVLLLRMNSQTILIDPMLGPNAAPIAPTPSKRFSENTLDLIDQFPEIDLVILSHDHYDHLDMDSIEKLKPKVKQFFVAMGVKRHLVSWGIEAESITEFDWWDHQAFNQIDITFTPSRHFSGRGLTDRAKSLWGGWVFKTETENIWFSGDGGYGKHFKEVGEKLGPFDFAFMECGQYNEKWHLIHMFPEESVQAALDANVKKALPIHWGGFTLAMHTWQEPVEEFVRHSKAKGFNYFTTELGKINTLDSENSPEWWKE